MYRFSIKRVASEKDIDIVLRLRQSLIKRKSLSASVTRFQQRFFGTYSNEIGKIVKKPGYNHTIYPSVRPALGFATELAQWMV